MSKPRFMPRAGLLLVSAVALPLALSGCESRGGSALLGAGAGAAAGAGGYEYHLNRQRNQVEEDYQAGRISDTEYEIRMDQIQRDSLVR